MARYLFNLPTVQATQTVRLDTISGSDSPAADLLTADGTPIGSTLTADHIGFLPEVQGPDGVATLYLKVLTYHGAVTGTPVTLAGYSQDPPHAAPTAPGGSSPVAWTAVQTADYAASAGDAVPADASGGPVNVTLPTPTAGAKVTVKNIGATGTVTVLPNAAETIDGASSYPITAQWFSRDYLADGTNWLVV